MLADGAGDGGGGDARVVIRAFMLAGLASGLAGCAPGAVDIINALAKDPSAVCVTINSLYGSASYSRNHGCNASAVEVPNGK